MHFKNFSIHYCFVIIIDKVNFPGLLVTLKLYSVTFEFGACMHEKLIRDCCNLNVLMVFMGYLVLLHGPVVIELLQRELEM